MHVLFVSISSFTLMYSFFSRIVCCKLETVLSIFPFSFEFREVEFSMNHTISLGSLVFISMATVVPSGTSLRSMVNGPNSCVIWKELISTSWSIPDVRRLSSSILRYTEGGYADSWEVSSIVDRLVCSAGRQSHWNRKKSSKVERIEFMQCIYRIHSNRIKCQGRRLTFHLL